LNCCNSARWHPCYVHILIHLPSPMVFAGSNDSTSSWKRPTMTTLHPNANSKKNTSRWRRQTIRFPCLDL
jgi:hypothetical protein